MEIGRTLNELWAKQVKPASNRLSQDNRQSTRDFGAPNLKKFPNFIDEIAFLALNFFSKLFVES